MIDTVIFDLGGVLAANGRHSDVAARFPPEHADRIMELFMGPFGVDTDHPWHRLERGEITMDEMRRLNKEALEKSGITMPEPPAGSTDSGEAAFAFRLNEPMIELVHQLKGAGLRLGVLTNNVREMRPLWWPMLPFEELFDDVVDSSEVGLRKPDPAIYHLAMERLGSTPERTVFLDDLASNVEAADALGITGVFVEVDPTSAVERVRALTGVS